MDNNIFPRQTTVQQMEYVPADFLWMKLKYDVYVNKAIGRGLKDCKKGRIINVADLKEVYGEECL